MKQSPFVVALFCVLFSIQVTAQTVKEVDICIYGGSSAGVMAAYTAKKMGKTVLLIEPGKRLGGLTSGGLGFTDIGNKFAISGLALDYYRRLGKQYGTFESWIFEPGVAASLFNEYIKKANVEVWYEKALISLTKNRGAISEISVRHPYNAKDRTVRVKAKIYLDCSYEGDLLAKAGVSYTIGREANSQYGETYNGVQVEQYHQFPDGVDPYKIPGDPSSGLLWGISPEPLQPIGSGDKKVQAYNFRICLTNNPANRLPIEKPADYQPYRYELLLRYLNHGQPKTLRQILKMDLMPNYKTDINNNGPFSTDMIGENYDYPEASYEQRKAIIQKHTDYTKGLLYFIGNDPRVPESIRKEMLTWGYPKDEYVETGHWSPQLYVREARRMVGEYVMTQANCEGKEVVTDGVGMAAYTMDSHNTQRLVINGMVKNEGDVQVGGFGPYPISYRSLIPKKSECTNLLVPICLSASHIAYGSIRMEPVFMVLAQSSAVAASMAIDQKKAVQDIDVKKLQLELKNNPLADGSTPEIILDNADATAVTINGNWKKMRHGYGPDYLLAEQPTSTDHVVFQPTIKTAGEYSVYVYVMPRYPNLASRYQVMVQDGQKEHLVILDREQMQVSGQTSGGWKLIGSYQLGKNARISIGSAGEKGVIIADAVLLKPSF
ncbi:FAD-dependent oxidoreductase [Flavihumibacter sp. RY-1]|uniref:FAD-dependent oxidoreductase n=1 Tax=Flavihumibacter fluminis TaxID=2909236 RepID=A0ABS9BM71_9BACT|nr:FAD-dependent oxidoreductase [Flavihumibacter fluminis]MCF1716833.1 FAD-dependent oxidoreductase [Flavihumibacter fluminis]